MKVVYCLSRGENYVVYFAPPPFRQKFQATILVSDVYFKRICSVDTSAFSALDVLGDNRAI